MRNKKVTTRYINSQESHPIITWGSRFFYILGLVWLVTELPIALGFSRPAQPPGYQKHMCYEAYRGAHYA